MSKNIDEVAIFTLLGYEMLATAGKDGTTYRWRHVVWSGFNSAFRNFFPNKDPKTELDRLAKADMIKVNIAKGGANFIPEPALLHPLSTAEKVVADKIRDHLNIFINAREVAKAKRAADKVDPKVLQAALLIQEGKLPEAMKLLGY